jgi:hypothetical protein
LHASTPAAVGERIRIREKEKREKKERKKRKRGLSKRIRTKSMTTLV